MDHESAMKYYSYYIIINYFVSMFVAVEFTTLRSSAVNLNVIFIALVLKTFFTCGLV